MTGRKCKCVYTA